MEQFENDTVNQAVDKAGYNHVFNMLQAQPVGSGQQYLGENISEIYGHLQIPLTVF